MLPSSPRCRTASSSPPSPPWEVLHAVSRTLDADSLAAASCVSKSWRAVFSSDDLWEPLCRAHFPSSLQLTPALSASPRRLFLLLRTASILRRGGVIPRAPPPLSIRRLLFMVDVFQRGAPAVSLAMAGGDLAFPQGIFRFDARAAGDVEFGEAARVVWAVATAECREAVVLMDHVRKPRSVGAGNELWFSEKLPCPAACCCTSTVALAGGRLEAQVFMELCGECQGGGGDMRRVEKVGVGLLDCEGWRYAKVDDALRYLQYFLFSF